MISGKGDPSLGVVPSKLKDDLIGAAAILVAVFELHLGLGELGGAQRFEGLNTFQRLTITQ